MRIYFSAAATAGLLAVLASIGLSHLQESVANAFSDPSAVRLDYQEAVNIYGRQADGE